MTQRDEEPRADADDAVLEVASEEFAVGIRQTVTGRVRVSTHTETMDQIVRQDLESLRAEVVRVPIERTLEPGEDLPVPRVEGAVTIIPVVEEVLVIETRLHLKEEVRVTRHASVEEVEIPVALRRQQAVVEHVADDPAPHTTSQNPPKEHL